MDGPYYGRPAYDDVIQGLSGSADLMARLVDEPRYMPTIMADKTCGLVTVNAILAALYEREQSGEGQLVEIPMLETMVAFNMADHIFGHAFEPPEVYGVFPRPDTITPSLQDTRRLYLPACYTDPQWERFWAEVGVPELKDDPRFDSLASRADNIEAVYSLAGEYIATRNTAEWLEVLPRLEIPCGEIVELESLPDDPHLQAVEFFRSEDHPTEGKITIPDIAVQFSRTPGSIDRLASSASIDRDIARSGIQRRGYRKFAGNRRDHLIRSTTYENSRHRSLLG